MKVDFSLTFNHKFNFLFKGNHYSLIKKESQEKMLLHHKVKNSEKILIKVMKLRVINIYKKIKIHKTYI